VLVVEADSSVGDEALALSPEASNDLDLQETSQGFRTLLKLAIKQGVFKPEKGDKFVSVLITDTREKILTGAGRSHNADQLIRYFKEADIIIDSQNPLINNILKWAKKV